MKNEEKFFLKLTDKTHLMCFEESYRYFFSKNSFNDLKIIENTEITSFLENVNKLVNFGWKKEAIPIIRTKKSLIARFFDTLFS